MRTRQIKWLMSAGLLAMVLVTGCAPQNTAEPVVHLGDLVEAEEQRVEAEKQAMIIEEAERLRLEYADGVYLEDYAEIRDKLNRQAAEQIVPKIESDMDFPLVLYVDVKLYNTGIREAKENDYDLQWILDHKPELVKEFGLSGALFIDDLEDTTKRRFYVYDDIRLIVDEIETLGVALGPNNFDVYNVKYYEGSAEWYKQQFGTSEELYAYMRNKIGEDVYFHTDRVTTHCYGTDTPANFKPVLNLLREKYNTDFRIDTPTSGLISSGDFVFSPMFDPELKFAANEYEDRFLSVFSQKLLSEKINGIIEEEGAGNNIAYFTAVDYMNDTPCDARKALEDPEWYLRNVLTNADISFYYLKTPEEEVDYRKLIDVISRSSLLLEENEDVQAFAFIYEMNEVDRQTALKLFEDATVSEGYFHNESGMDTWISSRFTVSNESDCFKFIEAFGTSVDFVYRVTSAPDVGTPVEKFKRIYKQRTIWED